jgi:hypothetical protein
MSFVATITEHGRRLSCSPEYAALATQARVVDRHWRTNDPQPIVGEGFPSAEETSECYFE